MKDACSEERVKIFEDQFSSEEASYAEAKYQLSYNQYLIQIIVVISYALYCGVPVFK